MLEDIRKGLLAGFGAVFLTKEKIEEVTRKLVAEARLSQEAGERLRNELLATGDQQWKELEKTVSGAIRRTAESLHVASHGEVQELSSRVDDMERRLRVLEKASLESKES